MKRLKFTVAVGIGLIFTCSIISIGILHQASERLKQAETRWGHYTFAADSNLQYRVHTSIAASRQAEK